MSVLSRRRFVQGVGVAGLGLVAGCGRLPWQTQPASKVHRIGWLLLPPPREPSPDGSPLAAFRDGLRDLGYVDGQHFVLETRGGPEEQLPDLAEELTRLPVDVIVTGGGAATLQAASQTTST